MSHGPLTLSHCPLTLRGSRASGSGFRARAWARGSGPAVRAVPSWQGAERGRAGGGPGWAGRARCRAPPPLPGALGQSSVLRAGARGALGSLTAPAAGPCPEWGPRPGHGRAGPGGARGLDWAELGPREEAEGKWLKHFHRSSRKLSTAPWCVTDSVQWTGIPSRLLN